MSQPLVHCEDPTTIRREILSRVLETAEADLALFYRLANVEGELCLTDWAAAGDLDTAERMMRPWDGRPWPSVPMMQPAEPQRRATSAFLESRALWTEHELETSRPWQTLVVANGLEDQTRLLVYQGEALVGWIGALRSAGGPRFGRADRARLAPLVAEVRDALIAAESLAHPQESAFLVVDPEGAVDHATPSAMPWLASEAFREQLRRYVRACDREEAPRRGAIWHADATLTRLDGPGRVRYLVSVAPAPLPKRRAQSLLSPAEREVVQLASAGATTAEIARHVGRTHDTVKTHLRSAYRKLGVASRLELARAIRD